MTDSAPAKHGGSEPATEGRLRDSVARSSGSDDTKCEGSEAKHGGCVARSGSSDDEPAVSPSTRRAHAVESVGPLKEAFCSASEKMVACIQYADIHALEEVQAGLKRSLTLVDAEIGKRLDEEDKKLETQRAELVRRRALLGLPVVSPAASMPSSAPGILIVPPQPAIEDGRNLRLPAAPKSWADMCEVDSNPSTPRPVDRKQHASAPPLSRVDHQSVVAAAPIPMPKSSSFVVEIVRDQFNGIIATFKNGASMVKMVPGSIEVGRGKRDKRPLCQRLTSGSLCTINGCTQPLHTCAPQPMAIQTYIDLLLEFLGNHNGQREVAMERTAAVGLKHLRVAVHALVRAHPKRARIDLATFNGVSKIRCAYTAIAAMKEMRADLSDSIVFSIWLGLRAHFAG